MGAYSSQVIIEEVGVGQARRVILSGGGLPFMGAEWGDELQVVTTWYPGNGDEATQQVLGPRLLPSSWEGEWKRTILPKSGCKLVDGSGAETQVFAPSQLRDFLRDMFRGGMRLRVTWRVAGTSPGDSDEIVREGRCKTFKTPHDRTQDIKWSMEFHWMSEGKRKQKQVSSRDADLRVTIVALSASTSNLVSALAAANFISKNRSIRKSATSFTLGQLENLAGLPDRVSQTYARNAQRIFNQVAQLGQIVQKLRAVPFQVANNAVGLARNMTSQTKNFLNAMGRVPPEQQSLKSGAGDVARSFRHFGGAVDAAEEVSRRAVQAEAEFRSALARGALRGQPSRRQVSGTRQDIIAIHVVKAGDTLIRLSNLYYGNPDHGTDIARSNRLPWYSTALALGRPLIIPVLSTRAGSVV